MFRTVNGWAGQKGKDREKEEGADDYSARELWGSTDICPEEGGSVSPKRFQKLDY